MFLIDATSLRVMLQSPEAESGYSGTSTIGCSGALYRTRLATVQLVCACQARQCLAALGQHHAVQDAAIHTLFSKSLPTCDTAAACKRSKLTLKLL
jgi:hypothetical protein